MQMESSELKSNFILEWLKKKKLDKNLDQEIIFAIEKCLGGVQQEEFDEAKLLKMLQELNKGGK